MAHAAKVLPLLSKSAVGLSTKLSVAAVLGIAALPLLQPVAASRGDASASQAVPAPLPVATSEPPPLVQGMPVEPVIQVAARRSRPKREPEPAPDAGEASTPTHKVSGITPASAPSEAPAPKPEEAPAGAEKMRPKQAVLPETREAAPEHERTPAAAPKVSAIAPPEPAKAPTAASEAKPETTPAEPPKPETWSDAEIIAGLRACVQMLAPIAAEVEISEPVKHEACGTPAPVLLKRISSGVHKVELSPPAVLNCAMVVGLHNWVQKTLQPAAQEALGSPIVRLRNASGYACRARNGLALGTDKLSEHALANAIDIAGFITADGRSIDVARFWGPTARDEQAAKLAAAHAKDAKKEPGKAEAAKAEAAHARPASKKVSAIASGPAPPSKKQDAKLSKTAELQRLGRGTPDVRSDPKAIPATEAPGRDDAKKDDAKKSAEAGFLRRLHKGACGVFGTVLGPEANDLHRNHFHFDLANRRRSGLCQ
jgi:hypothetical protein